MKGIVGQSANQHESNKNRLEVSIEEVMIYDPAYIYARISILMLYPKQ